MSTGKEKLINLVIRNKFITKPRLVKLFYSLIDDVEKTGLVKNLSLQNVSGLKYKIMKKTNVVVVNENPSTTNEWGVSFTNHNPELKDYVRCASEEDAFKLKQIIELSFIKK